MRQTLALLCLLVALPAQERPLAFLGARVLPIDGPEIADGLVLVQDGKIRAVGAREDLLPDLPGDTVRRDLTGKVLMPGLICTHSHIGDVSGGDRSAAIHPSVRALDAIDARHAGIRRARAGGITCANVMPGSGHLMSGQTIYLKLRRGETVEELLIRDDAGRIAGGMKMANGTNSIGNSPFPGTRARSAAMVRARFLLARAYQKKIAAAAGDPEKMPDRDLGLEALAEVLEGRRVVHHHTHRHDDILTVLRLSKEFGFRVVLHHVSDAWKVADEIAAAKAPCSIIMIDSPGGKLEAADIRFENGAALESAGASVSFHTDDPITDSRLFLRSPALAVRAGMSRKAALEGVTLAAAKQLDLGDRLGSLTPGKDADFVVLSGDPLSVYSLVLETWIEGRRVFDRADPADLRDATGGVGAGQPRMTNLCCFGPKGSPR